MKLLLDTEDDIITYINYLHENEKLLQFFKQIVVPNEQLADYLSYFSTKVDCTTIQSAYEDRAGKRWSQEEKLILQELINSSTPIQEIATSLRRTVESIRKQARTSLDAVYIDNEWLDIPF